MNRNLCITVLFSLLVLSPLYADKPHWWDNPHKDDQFALYQRGSASDGANEQDAVRHAVRAAKDMLVERIGILPALEAAGLSASPEYAIVNFQIADTGTERQGKKWAAWVLIKYPQEEKQKILDRWHASIVSIDELKKTEERIPIQFGLSLQTADGRTQYREGESLSFRIKADADCHLILLDHQSDGTTVLLFPNRFNPRGFIRKGETIILPSLEDNRFDLVVGPPFGDDRIEAIAATGENTLHAKFSELTAALPEDQNIAVARRGIFVQGVGEALASPEGKSVKWSRAELNLSTFQGE